MRNHIRIQRHSQRLRTQHNRITPKAIKQRPTQNNSNHNKQTCHVHHQNHQFSRQRTIHSNIPQQFKLSPKESHQNNTMQHHRSRRQCKRTMHIRPYSHQSYILRLQYHTRNKQQNQQRRTMQSTLLKPQNQRHSNNPHHKNLRTTQFHQRDPRIASITTMSTATTIRLQSSSVVTRC